MGQAIPWAGFASAMKGRLLEQVVDLRSALGVAYERSVGYEKAAHVHDRSMIVCARGSAAMDIVVGAQRFRADRAHLVWVPRGVPHADESATTLYDTVALYPSEAMLASAARDAQLQPSELGQLTKVVRFAREAFFDELLTRWFCARLVERATTSPFQDRQLVGEALRLLFAKRSSSSPQPVGSSVAERALRHIEAHLFSPLSLEEIAARAGASVASLLRHFRTAYSHTPYAYMKARRLDEARQLLRTGDHRVGEVALLIGYDDLGAFSKAYRARFGRSPSAESQPKSKRRR